ncbi:MFS general substrate transporter [Choiromyces venosus 120613-1]|uniref:MFS general substrate transporter n=1 Tax=Choiromyces venosus 120613-1 TaxID=1336337 RepID=A0A3N4JS26_9PEZI|nr:MFS general substrate transporter [Choiromyces venosus 120613-1]
MANQNLERTISIRTLHGEDVGATDYSEPLPVEVMRIEGNVEQNKHVIYWEPGDPDNPHNWSDVKKWIVSIIGIITVSNSTFASSLPSGAVSYIKEDLNIASTELTSLTISIFLIGYVVGPIFFAPVSEFYGRRWVSIIAFSWYTVMNIGCALSPNIGALLAFRFLTGIGASAPLSVTGGQLADLWDDPVKRGRLMAVFCACTMVGPTLAPFISGYISETALGWRMAFWLGFIVAAISFIPLIFFCPETYAPILLLRRAQKMRTEGDIHAVAPLELDDRSLKSIFATTLTRPFRMFWQESTVFFTSMFLSLLYGTFYLSFQSFPMIYQDIYGFTPGTAGLFFLPLAVGAGLACIGGIIWDSYCHRRQKQNPNVPLSPEFRRLPIGLLGGLAYCMSLFWQAWTARGDIHYIVPALSGIPFGFGFCIVFLAFLNYLTDAYEIYAASAMAAASMCRSLLGAAFPLFARIMYDKLTIPWASSLLAFAALGMSFIPILFIRYGESIRARSKFCQFLLERKRILLEEEKAREASRAASRSVSRAPSLKELALEKETV